MYIFNKKRRKSQKKEKSDIVLPRDKHYKNAVLSGTCPSCTGRMTKVEDGQQVKFECTKCHADYTTDQIKYKNWHKRRETRFKAIKLIDRSNDKTSPYDYTNNTVVARNKDVEEKVMLTIRDAMQKKKMLQFRYVSGAEEKIRLVEPYKLTLDGSKNAILYAYCTEGEGIRVFRVTRMLELKVSEYDYKLQWNIEDLIDVPQAGQKRKQ